MCPSNLFLYLEGPLEHLIRISGIIQTPGNVKLQNEDLAFTETLN